MSAVQAESRLPSRRQRKKPNTIRVVDETPKKYAGSIHCTNLSQQKERFLKYGILPQFVLKAPASHIEALANKPAGQVSHQYVNQAKHILQLVRDKFKTGDEYFLQAFGERIDIETASYHLTEYLNMHGLDGQMGIVFSSDLDCSARMMWHGPSVKLKKPEARRHTLIIRNSSDNFYLRQHGINCIANHEIGTHYLRTINDGLQPWYGDRKTFGLRSVRSYEFKKSEEGLAALNTILQAKVKYLYGPALGYYVACMAESMTFKELFHHLEEFVQDAEKRWHYVMRVKRHLADPNDLGGYGNDQCYFEDFPLMYSGTLCQDELSRVKRLARQNCVKLPHFLQDVEGYKQQLRWIGYVNGLLPKPQPRKKAKRPYGLLSQQGTRPGLRESNSRQSLMKPVTSYSMNNLYQTPSNMVLIHDSTKKSLDESSYDEESIKASDLLGVERKRPVSVSNMTGNKEDHCYNSPCILQKLSSRLSFHDDLIKRVESKLSCAALSLKQSEKIMLKGLKGKRGLATVTPPPATLISLDQAPVHMFNKLGFCADRDQGQYSVQARPPLHDGQP